MSAERVNRLTTIPEGQPNMSEQSKKQASSTATGAIALSDGTIFLGKGAGAEGVHVGELCFNTAITGYQEILTDPSYSSQIVLFTFPHVGNVGANADDHEESSIPGANGACGTIFREPITAASNWRSGEEFGDWLTRRNIVALSGVDTRAITRIVREKGMQKAAICHKPDGNIDLDELIETAVAWNGLETADLAADVDTDAPFENAQRLWQVSGGYSDMADAQHHVVVVDFGVKKNILRNLAQTGIRTSIVNGDATADEIFALNPDGVVFSNGPGDPAATIARSGDMIRAVINKGLPILGICLGHQLLALALGAKTMKMAQGHHGANHPVKDLVTGKVEIVSMNHGFTVDPTTLPEGVEESHRSLFDGTNSGLAVKNRPIISVQHHPEASPGPQDSFYLFRRFADLMAAPKS
jgi:carbamoyl-phosphate synthase small subunit